jgi:hypothetical protein
MPKFKAKDKEIQVSAERVARMAERLYKLGGAGRRDNYVAKALKRLEAGTGGKADAAVAIAAGK